MTPPGVGCSEHRPPAPPKNAGQPQTSLGSSRQRPAEGLRELCPCRWFAFQGLEAWWAPLTPTSCSCPGLGPAALYKPRVMMLGLLPCATPRCTHRHVALRTWGAGSQR